MSLSIVFCRCENRCMTPGGAASAARFCGENRTGPPACNLGCLWFLGDGSTPVERVFCTPTAPRGLALAAPSTVVLQTKPCATHLAHGSPSRGRRHATLRRRQASQASCCARDRPALHTHGMESRRQREHGSPPGPWPSQADLARLHASQVPRCLERRGDGDGISRGEAWAPAGGCWPVDAKMSSMSGPAGPCCCNEAISRDGTCPECAAGRAVAGRLACCLERGQMHGCPSRAHRRQVFGSSPQRHRSLALRQPVQARLRGAFGSHAMPSRSHRVHLAPGALGSAAVREQEHLARWHALHARWSFIGDSSSMAPASKLTSRSR